MSEYVRCICCHEWISADDLDSHLKHHEEILPNGQHRDHATLPPEERYEGPLDDVPQWYVHEICGAVTGMPEEIVRSYLMDPFMYNTRTFCAGCRDYFRKDQFRWTMTGEYLDDYDSRRRLEHARSHPFLTIEPEAAQVFAEWVRAQFRWWSPYLWLRRLSRRTTSRKDALLRLEYDGDEDQLHFGIDFDHDPRRDWRKRFGELRVVVDVFEFGHVFNGMTLDHDGHGFGWTWP